VITVYGILRVMGFAFKALCAGRAECGGMVRQPASALMSAPVLPKEINLG
jgi:hypothetical protein